MKERSKREKNMNVKLSKEEYQELQEIAEALGGITLSSMIRMVIYPRLEKVRKSGDPKQFISDT